MSIDKKLERLKHINKVDAPPFLFTRIQQRLQSLTDAPAPVQWTWTFAATALLVLLLNTGVILKATSNKNNPGLQEVISTMHLSSSNNLYDE